MLCVHPVRKEWRSRLPAITHADGTARVHAVRPETNPLFHDLLIEFGRYLEETGANVDEAVVARALAMPAASL